MAERTWKDWVTSPWQSLKAKVSEMAGNAVEDAARERLGPVADLFLPAKPGSATPAPARTQTSGTPAPAAGSPAPSTDSPAPATNGSSQKSWFDNAIDNGPAWLKKLFGKEVDTSSGAPAQGEGKGFNWDKVKTAGKYGLAMAAGIGVAIMASGSMGIFGAILMGFLAYAVAHQVLPLIGKAFGGSDAKPSTVGGTAPETGSPQQQVSQGASAPAREQDKPGAAPKTGIAALASRAKDAAWEYYNKGEAWLTNTSGKVRGRMDEAVTFFKSKGWSEEQATGMVANLAMESGNMDPRSKEKGGGDSIGLAQWRPPRQRDFEAWAGHKIDAPSMNTDALFRKQLEFVHHELTDGKEKPAGDRLRSAKTAAEAAEIMTRYYERPAAPDKDSAKRAGLADAMMAASTARAQADAAIGAAQESSRLAMANAKASPVAPAAVPTVIATDTTKSRAATIPSG